jgi:hypothetical protein
MTQIADTKDGSIGSVHFDFPVHYANWGELKYLNCLVWCNGESNVIVDGQSWYEAIVCKQCRSLNGANKSVWKDFLRWTLALPDWLTDQWSVIIIYLHASSVDLTVRMDCSFLQAPNCYSVWILTVTSDAISSHWPVLLTIIFHSTRSTRPKRVNRAPRGERKREELLLFMNFLPAHNNAFGATEIFMTECFYHVPFDCASLPGRSCTHYAHSMHYRLHSYIA